MESIRDSQTLNRETDYGSVRLAMECDVPGIISLLTPPLKRLFRLEDPDDKLRKLIHFGLLTITHLDTKGRVIGFLALDDYPLVPAIDPSVWEQWVWNSYKAQALNARNSLFISAFVWSDLYGIDLMKAMLSFVFMHDMYLQHLTIYKADSCDNLTDDAKADNIFRRIVANVSGGKGDNLACLLVAYRKDVCPPLRVRKAMESDNDEVVNIINAQTDRLKNLYGSYYISELVACHPESNRVILVAEKEDWIVGVMSFDDRVNYVALAKDFDLAPYCGLVKHNVNQPEMCRKHSKIDDEHNQIHQKKKDTEMRDARESFVELDTNIKVTTETKQVEIKSMTSSVGDSLEMAEDIIIDILEVLAFNIDFDFEIVNIESNLLKVPISVSSTTFAYEDTTHHEFNQSNVNKSEYLQKKMQYPHKQDVEIQKQSSVNFFTNKVNTVSLDFIANAFKLELFAIKVNLDERIGYEILRTAFDEFSKYDYCILIVPTNTKAFPLLDHFTRVSQSVSKQTFCDASLYIAHRNSICGNLSVRLAEVNDIPTIETFLAKLPKRNELTLIITESLTNVNGFGYQTLILLSENQPVGFTTVSKLRERVFIRGKYNLDHSAQFNTEDGNILVCVFIPVLQPHSRWYAREILRHTGFQTMIWKSQILGHGFSAPATKSLIDSMAPAVLRVPPEIKIELSKPFHWDGDKALWYIDRPMTSLQKLDINANILVIGAGYTSVAFLENLIFGPNSKNLTFSNISLVSPQGFSVAAEYMKSVRTCLPDYYFSHRNVSILPFLIYVDIITAKMVHIDRKLKFITLDNGNVKYYDYLVLCCGKQFQLPTLPVRVPKDTSPCRLGHLDKLNFKDYPFLHAPDTMPDNLMLINSVIDANDCLSRLIKIIGDANQQDQRDRLIIVYGNRIEVYTCISSILETKSIQPQDIVFVDPTSRAETSYFESITCFNDDEIDERVTDTMKAIGIKMYSNFEFHTYEVAYNRIHTLKFISNHQIISFPCLAFFYFGNQQTDYQTYSAISNCGLVWNGGLIIDSNFRTNDSYIYAAGVMTRYSSALYANKYLHMYYHPCDIGRYLAEVFLNFLDPLHHKAKPTNSNVVPTFSGPCTCYAILPGSWHYLQVSEPGQPIPVLVRRTLGIGHTLSTDKDGNSFLIHLNSENEINGITCLSKKSFSPSFLAMLYGKHEKIFGNLIRRHNLCLIDDFFDYFNQNWISDLVYEMNG